MEFGQEQRNR